MNSWHEQIDISLFETASGVWKETSMCHMNTFIDGIQSKLDQSKDLFSNVISINGLKFKCNKRSTEENSTTSWVDALEGKQYKSGKWNAPVLFPHFHICGAKGRYKEAKGILMKVFGTEAGLNGLELLFCKARVLQTINIEYLFNQAEVNISTKRSNHSLTLSNRDFSKAQQLRDSRKISFPSSFSWSLDKDYFFDISYDNPLDISFPKVRDIRDKTFFNLNKRVGLGLVPNLTIEENLPMQVNFRVFSAPQQCMNNILVLDFISFKVPFKGKFLTEDGVEREISGTFNREYVHDDYSFINEEC